MEWSFGVENIGMLLTLSVLEIILGIDNIIFIALVVQHLDKSVRTKARMIGLSLALIFRIAMLLGIGWIIQLKEPLLSIMGNDFSGKDLFMLAGGLFLIVKGTLHVHEMFGHEQEKEYKGSKKGFSGTIGQIIFIDLIFSLDSVMTAVGLTKNIPVIIIAMTIAMGVMMFASGVTARFIEKYPTLKVLGIAFVIMIGIFLMAEGFGLHIPRGYIYAAMLFSMSVETINILVHKKQSGKRY